SIPSLNVMKVADIADKILDTSPIQVSLVSDSCIATNVSPDSELLTEIKLLCKEIALLRHSRSHSRNRQPCFRQKGIPVKNEQCWCHRRMGSIAVKCISTRNYPVNSNGKE
ncbi:uncharacterized protein NPIL_221641, partial [Nephila pilipes]